ncbi:hypothetical protein PILCRDRAFT_812068 [Piloderma croceum F 1598]|uniref:Uncharacterized protein n=1 Tax=Piloderma croceum (strain F 1598) TaxID=765440 RepID=A0A0C3BUV3_PILCF|nr:hypothetical protein PILCRDRAFT_812068 [Piloderma croceum F 1598]
MTKLFESFVSSYATSEDDIRKLWVLIGEEQKMLLVRTLTSFYPSILYSNLTSPLHADECYITNPKRPI